MGVSEVGRGKEKLCKSQVCINDGQKNKCLSHCKTIKSHNFSDSDSLSTMNKERTGKGGAERDKDRGFTSTFVQGGFYESSRHSKNTPHTPSPSVRGLDVLVVTLL